MILHIILLMILVSKVFFYALHLISKHAEWLWKLNLSVMPSQTLSVSSSTLKKHVWICNSIKKWYSYIHKIMTWAISHSNHILKKISQAEQPLQVIMTHTMMYKKGALLLFIWSKHNTMDFCNLDPTQKLVVWIILNIM